MDALPALRRGVPSGPSEEGCEGHMSRGLEDKLGSGPSFLGKRNTKTQKRHKPLEHTMYDSTLFKIPSMKRFFLRIRGAE